MDKNSLKKLRNFIKKEADIPYVKQIIPGNVRLSMGLYRTEEEQKEYIKKIQKKIKKFEKKEEKQYKKYLKRTKELK